MTAARPSQAALTRAAKVAAAQGVRIVIEAGDTTWRIEPMPTESVDADNPVVQPASPRKWANR